MVTIRYSNWLNFIANITTTLNVTPGQILYVVVGGFPGQSTTPKYGFGGSGGSGTNYGGAGGGLSGLFTSSSPANANALVVAGGGGGGGGYSGTTSNNRSSGNGGSGTVIIKLPTGWYDSSSSSGTIDVSTEGANEIIRFKSSGILGIKQP